VKEMVNQNSNSNEVSTDENKAPQLNSKPKKVQYHREEEENWYIYL